MALGYGGAILNVSHAEKVGGSLTRNACSTAVVQAIRCVRMCILEARILVDEHGSKNTDMSGILMAVVVANVSRCKMVPSGCACAGKYHSPIKHICTSVRVNVGWRTWCHLCLYVCI